MTFAVREEVEILRSTIMDLENKVFLFGFENFSNQKNTKFQKLRKFFFKFKKIFWKLILIYSEKISRKIFSKIFKISKFSPSLQVNFLENENQILRQFAPPDFVSTLPSLQQQQQQQISLNSISSGNGGGLTMTEGGGGGVGRVNSPPTTLNNQENN